MKRTRAVWVCDLCEVEHDMTFPMNVKVQTPNGWVTQSVIEKTDKKRYQIRNTFLSFCSPEHKTLFMEAAARAKKEASVAAEEVMQKTFVEVMEKAKEEMRSAVDRLADLGRGEGENG